MKHIHLEFRFANRNFLLHDGPIWQGTKIEKKFVILAQYRTGSTLLTELLNAHPDIQCDGEIFFQAFEKYQKVLFPCLLMEKRFRDAKTTVYGLGLKLEQIQNVLIRQIYDSNRFLNKLHTKGWQFIRIKRTNILRQALSNIIANQKGEWHSWSKGIVGQEKIFIDGAQLLRSMQGKERNSLLADRLLENIPHLKIQYEEDLLRTEVHQKTIDRVCTF
jgi:LPS sulfotransferase NodH